jgi:hypothetical protein
MSRWRQTRLPLRAWAHSGTHQVRHGMTERGALCAVWPERLGIEDPGGVLKGLERCLNEITKAVRETRKMAKAKAATRRRLLMIKTGDKGIHLGVQAVLREKSTIKPRVSERRSVVLSGRGGWHHSRPRLARLRQNQELRYLLKTRVCSQL